MALKNPAAFGKASQFGSIYPIPTWARGAPNEYKFAFGWFPISDTTAAVPVTNYGAPFLDFSVEIVASLTYSAVIIDTIDRIRKWANTRIDRAGRFVSTRIDKSVDEHEP